ncbi:hypothetical protein [Pleionea sp. CnH1-48]|uniref:HzsA-related protein n=1 Tax=Pleionea sp. CnH1-48 TaxID=2954494 RepID=UPI002096DBC5|nr:hypothetical protein [Pleionea sp. CnH1-48]MCO7227475.1 hypothetical protein [Pleionea sp. CnH1-48]
MKSMCRLYCISILLTTSLMAGCGGASEDNQTATPPPPPDNGNPGNGGNNDSLFKNPIIYVQQKKSIAGEFQINDIHGNFLGDNPPADQPIGGNLFRLDPGSNQPVNLTQKTNAAVRNPEVSWDGRKVIFSMKLGEYGLWQIYEINVDGSGLKRITHTTHNETEPAYLPDGRIVFASDRGKVLDPYEQHPVGYLYIMNADGSQPFMMTSDPGGDMTPTISESGKILFTRWSATIRFPDLVQADTEDPFDPLDISRFLLWETKPNGYSDAHPIFGAHFPPDFKGGFVQARPLYDGTGRIVSTMATAETWGAGAVVIIDPKADGLTAKPQFITPQVAYSFEDPIPDGEGRYRDPYPMKDSGFIVSFALGQVLNLCCDDESRPEVPDFGLYKLSNDGKRTLIFNNTEWWELEPVEVVARTKPPVLNDTARTDVSWGILNTKDVRLRERNGNDPQSEQNENQAAFVNIYKAVPSHYTFAAFPGYRQVYPALIGRAPVASDGSFAAKVPANVPLLWETVDNQGNVIIRERFWNAVKPGEVQTCSGCHSPHDKSEGNISNLALNQPTDLTQVDLSSLIPGSNDHANACQFEWHTEQPRRIIRATGISDNKLECHDGDPACDHDAESGFCSFQIGGCINVNDPRQYLKQTTQCNSHNIHSLELLQTQTGSVSLSDFSNKLSQLGTHVFVNGTQTATGSAQTGFACSNKATIKLPINTTETLTVITTNDQSINTRSELTLQCKPVAQAPTCEREWCFPTPRVGNETPVPDDNPVSF